MYGRTVLAQNSVFPTRVSADGSPVYKVAGLTVDWTKFTAASGDVTLPDGSVIKDGQKYIRYGQVLAMITATGKYGPHDPALTNGQEIITRGRCYIVDQTVLQYSSGSASLGAVNDHIGGVFDGGAVFIDRILQSGAGSHSVTAGPTLVELLAAFPLLQSVTDV